MIALCYSIFFALYFITFTSVIITNSSIFHITNVFFTKNLTLLSLLSLLLVFFLLLLLLSLLYLLVIPSYFKCCYVTKSALLLLSFTLITYSTTLLFVWEFQHLKVSFLTSNSILCLEY